MMKSAGKWHSKLILYSKSYFPFAVLKRLNPVDNFGEDREPVITYIKGVKHIEFS
jgi:hypothetical protein